MQQRFVRFGEFFVSHQQFSESVKPRVSNFDNPSAASEQWIVFLFLDFLSALLYERNIVSVFDSLLCGLAVITLVCTQILNGVRAFNGYFIQYKFKLTHIVSVCSGYDYR